MDKTDFLLTMTGALTGVATEMAFRDNNFVRGVAVGASTAYAMKDFVKNNPGIRNMMDHALLIGTRLAPLSLSLSDLESPSSDLLMLSTGLSALMTHRSTTWVEQIRRAEELRELEQQQRAQGENWWEAPPPAQEEPVPPRPRRRRNL